MTTDAAIEALLFYTGEAHSLESLAKQLDVSVEEIQAATQMLRERLSGGVVLVETNNTIQLTTAPNAHELIQKLRQEELSRDLGKAGTETLAIVAYQGPVAKSTIDFIRGVNCASILRNLLVRGLIVKTQNPDDPRGVLYQPSIELLTHLGIQSVNDLPDYNNARAELNSYFTQEER